MVMRGRKVGLTSLMLLGPACVPLEPQSIPDALGLGALILVDPRRPAVLAAPNDVPRAILTAEAEGAEAWDITLRSRPWGSAPGP